MKNISKLLLALGFWLACVTPVFADTLITAPITTDTEFTLAGSPYTVSSPATSVNINSGVTLTIDPGVVVNGTIEVGGNLIASGTPAMPVTINGRINASFGPATTTLSHTIVNGSLFAYFVTLNFFDVAFHVATSSLSHPIIVDGCHFTHASTTIDGSTENGYEMTLADLPTGEIWNADNPPYVVIDGDALSKYLLVTAGAVIKFQTTSFTQILGGGTLDVQGSTSSPVYLTSMKDDSVGGDTNGDGAASSPSRNDWNSLRINGGHLLLNHAVLSYANNPISMLSNVYGASVMGSYVRIASSTYGLTVSGQNTATSSTYFSNTEVVGNGVGIGTCGQNMTITNSVIAGNDTGTSGCSNGSSVSTIDLRNNWWGSASGPYNATVNPTGTGDSVVNNGTLYSPWLTSDPRNPAPACSINCNSNVMFLPGLEGSNLYSSSGQAWTPTVTGPNAANTLDLTNSSTANSVYTNEKDLVSNAYFVYGVYNSFITQMNSLASSSVVAGWEPIAYDWRLDYQTLLNNGNETSGGKIYYRGSNAATSTPYIIQELKKLAATSRTGKVTIVAHSNGGLLAKALLIQPGIAQYVDKVVLVATPQLGTPKAAAGILNGYETGLPSLFSLLFSDSDGRYIGQNMPTAYNLLPSAQYFSSTSTPVITFDPNTLGWMVSKYGASITSTSGLRSFMTDSTRPTPDRSDLTAPIVASSTLFDNAASVHVSLDNWAPPSGVQLITIAGWGNPTLVTLNYKKQIKLVNSQLVNATTTTPVLDFDGDDTVIDSSAQWATISTSTKYWINLETFNCQTWLSCLPISGPQSVLRKTHANLLEASPTLSLLEDLVTNSTSTLPDYVSPTRPTHDPSRTRRYFFLYSPLTLGFTDSSGNYTGSTATTTVFNAPGVDYQRFGEVQWLSVPSSLTGQVTLQGTGSGSFTLEVQEVNGNTITATTTFAAIPSATSTTASLAISSSTSPTASSTLLVDQDGNGTVDLTLQASQNSIVTPPASPTVTLVATTTSTFTVHYTNLPANSVLAFADVSHHVEGGYRTPIAAGGSGTTTIVAYGLPAGFTSVMALATTTATTSLAETPQFYLFGTASPVVTYVSGDVTGQTVTVIYNRMPTNNELVFVNTTTGAVVPGYVTTVTAGSAGTTTISVAGITPYGSYYLRARDATTHTTPTYAQTVNFYISDPNGGDGL